MKQSQATFKAFLIEGRLGPLSCGLTKDEVHGILGKPVNWYLNRKNFVTEPIVNYFESSTWHYGYLSTSFDAHDRVDAISLQVGDPNAQLPSWLEGYFPRQNEPLSELRHFLIQEQIPFKELPSRPVGFMIQIAEHSLVRVRGIESIWIITYHRELSDVQEYISDD